MYAMHHRFIQPTTQSHNFGFLRDDNLDPESPHLDTIVTRIGGGRGSSKIASYN
jgi:hypothetical protein